MPRRHERLWLIAYDISDNRQRTSVFRVLERYGGAVQKSVFECRLTRAELRALLDHILPMLDKRTDRLYAYPIRADEEKKIQAFGRPRPKANTRMFFIVE